MNTLFNLESFSFSFAKTDLFNVSASKLAHNITEVAQFRINVTSLNINFELFISSGFFNSQSRGCAYIKNIRKTSEREGIIIVQPFPSFAKENR